MLPHYTSSVYGGGGEEENIRFITPDLAASTMNGWEQLNICFVMTAKYDQACFSSTRQSINAAKCRTGLQALCLPPPPPLTALPPRQRFQRLGT